MLSYDEVKYLRYVLLRLFVFTMKRLSPWILLNCVGIANISAFNVQRNVYEPEINGMPYEGLAHITRACPKKARGIKLITYACSIQV